MSETEFDLRVLSLGAGVQSATMARMAENGEFPVKPDVLIFADTKAEEPHVYELLETLKREISIPIHVVTIGSLEKNLYEGGHGRQGSVQIPTFIKNAETGKRGIVLRGCSETYKIRAIRRKTREILGLKKGQRIAGRYKVEMWIGYSVDEVGRAKPDPEPWVTRRFPLLFDVPMRRWDCEQWHVKRGLPIPGPSSCHFCPFHSDSEWKRLRSQNPSLFERSCQMDDDLRSGKMLMGKNLRGEQYLHDSLTPLREVDLEERTDQIDLFENGCSGGTCGV